MSIETEIQRQVALPFFKEKLGYEFKSSNTIDWNLIIESDVERFLLKDFNIKSYDKVVKEHYSGNSKIFLKEYCEALGSAAFKNHNVAIFLKNKKFNFKGSEFILWQPSGSSFSERDLFGDNIFSITEELVYSPKLSFPHQKFNRRPDLAFFLNGIYFGYMELKHQNTQRAMDKGRDKVICNYIEAKSIFGTYGEKHKEECNRAMAIFERAIHITASDLHETYIIRNIAMHSNNVDNYLKEDRGDINRIASTFMNDFPLYPSDVKENDGKQRMEADWSNLYSKKSIENEILFYNYLEGNIDRIKAKETNKSARINNAVRLISPRPKQKFGIDKTISHVAELYKNESNNNYLSTEYAKKLKLANVDDIQIEKEVKNRLLLNNNNAIYSVLKQYAAGFGKTKLMCWEALQLNEMKSNDKTLPLFDKIILVSDRLDLKEQVAATMDVMPTIENGAWKEAISTDDFVKCLENKSCRIIVVNVQKFNFLSGKLNPKVKSLLVNARVSFIIDEIHRSHNGQQNDRMIELFDSIGHLGQGSKKNLIVGLTATAPQKILQRFGEVGALTSDGITFAPFDAFTMREAINGGYVLDPMKTFIPIHIPTFIDEDGITEENRKPGPKEYYGKSERIYKVIDHAVDTITSITFNKIRKKGKAMYIANSIASAIIAFKYFKEKFNEKYEDNDKKPKLFIVYSKPQDQKITTSASSLNNGLSEEKAISEFKKSKNAVIIVVDKLQTGFDEPTLHTIILNCERTGINMVQTLCRVNRTTKNKEDCMILDYSVTDPKTGKTKNELNAIDSFGEYAGLAVASFNPGLRSQLLKDKFLSVVNDKLFNDLFEKYKMGQRNPLYDVSTFAPAVKNANEDEVKELLVNYSNYAKELNIIEGVTELDSKYKNKIFIDFFSKVRSLLTNDQLSKLPLEFTVSDIEGFTILNIIDIIEGIDDDSPSAGKGGKSKKEDDLSQIERLKNEIALLNEFHEMNEDEIEKNNEIIISILTEMKNTPISKGDMGKLLSKIKDYPYGNYSEEFKNRLKYSLRRFKYNFADTKEGNKKGKEMLTKYTNDLSDYYYNEFIKLINL